VTILGSGQGRLIRLKDAGIADASCRSEVSRLVSIQIGF
jgi:hypothetical protein